ncbi:MAG: CHASE3 domain-containing protein [Thermoanaerobaculia bacterium]
MKAGGRERILTTGLLFGISGIFALMIANVFVSQSSDRDQRQAGKWVVHTFEVLANLDSIPGHMAEAEAAQRATILTSDEDYLPAYREATQAIESAIGGLRDQTKDNGLQQARLDRLQATVQKRFKEMEEALAVAHETGMLAGRQSILTNRHKDTMQALAEQIASLKAAENELLQKRLEVSESTYRRARLLSLFSGALGLLALAGFVFLVDRTLRAREAAAAEVARQRETLRVTLASIGDGVITTDTQGRVVFLNGEAERLTGWSTADAAGQALERIFHIVNESSRAAVPNPAARALADGVVVGLANHTILIAKDGKERPIDDSAAPIRNPRGQVAGVVLVFRDVTEERGSTNQLRTLAAELSEADRRKNEFLAILAHEIRNPLAAIRNSAAVLKIAGREPATTAQAQGAIDRQMEHLVRLVEDLLDVARISRGKLALRRSRIDLRTALDQAIEASRPLCKENEQALEIEIPERPLFVDGDATRITQAIGNLLSNACKFSQRGGRIRLTVGIEQGHAIVSIRDDGVGIAAEHLSRLFDMFSQVDTSLERTQGGLGIGLNLVKQLVEMHGGRVEARSAGLGHGSEFIVHFPLLIEDPVAAVAADAALAGGTPPPTHPMAALAAAGESREDVALPLAPEPHPGRRVLVVDDNEDSADSLALLLRLQGHEVSIARDGLEAVDMALRLQPEVILLDIGLPKLNGYEAARSIRLSPQGRTIRLIALTGWGQDEDRKLSRAAGFDEHLVKPVDADHLLELLDRPWEPPASA